MILSSSIYVCIRVLHSVLCGAIRFGQIAKVWLKYKIKKKTVDLH